jgi:hypothetical protein
MSCKPISTAVSVTIAATVKAVATDMVRAKAAVTDMEKATAKAAATDTADTITPKPDLR